MISLTGKRVSEQLISCITRAKAIIYHWTIAQNGYEIPCISARLRQDSHTKKTLEPHPQHTRTISLDRERPRWEIDS